MRSALRAPLACFAAVALAACQQLPRLPQTDADFQAMQRCSGRLAVQVEGDADRSFTANFELEGGASAGRLNLSSPLGTRIAQAQWQPGRAWLSNGGSVREFDELDTLAEEALGQRIPLAALFDWLSGRPWSGADSTSLPAPSQGFKQLGWEIQLDRWADRLVVAKRLTPPGVTVRAKLDEHPSTDPHAAPATR